MKRKLASIIFLIICSLILTSCFNYKEINQMTFATSVIFDKDENNNVIIYIDCVKPYRNAGDSSDEGKRMIFKGEGKTSLEAIRDISEISSNKLNFSQVRAYIFTEQVAQDGIKKHIDLINNDQQFGFKPYMFVYFGEISDILNIIGEDDEYLGLYLDDLVKNNKGNGKIISKNVNDYISTSLNKDAINILTAIDIKDDIIDKKIELNGGAIIQNDKMLKKMEPTEVLSYNLLMEPVNEGTFEIQNPKEEDKFITLDILEKNSLTKVIKEDNSFIINENLDIRVSIGEIQGAITDEIRRGNHIDTTTKLRQVIEKTLDFLPEKEKKETIKKTCQRTFQALRIDVNHEFEVLYEFMEKLPDALRPGGRVAILTFHSGEDKLVKKALKAGYKEGIYSDYAKDVIRPSAKECTQNPRARSTKMRWAIKAE